MKRLFTIMLLTFFCITTIAQPKEPALVKQVKTLQIENNQLRSELEYTKREIIHMTDKYDFISLQYQDCKDFVSSHNTNTLWVIGIIMTFLGIIAPTAINIYYKKNIDNKLKAMEEIDERIRIIHERLKNI